MFYIHHTSCISPQQTFNNIDIESLQVPVSNKMQVIEPSYEGIPTGILRRMGKAIRIAVGTALPLIKQNNITINGIIIGTANGGMEDCIKFLNQIIDYEEGMLTPTNFVQSTTNAIAAQIGLLSANKSYNTTHVQRGLAFENALLDAGMLLQENHGANYLVGGVDEISAYNYNIDWLDGWFKKESFSANNLYNSGTPGAVAGEGAAMFLVGATNNGALAFVRGLQQLHTTDELAVARQLDAFLKKYLPAGEKPDLLLSGEDGDSRSLPYYNACEAVLQKETTIARFKHMTGEYATASATALWIACFLLKEQSLPQHMVKYNTFPSKLNRILIYNQHKGQQHSFMLVEMPGT
ncbi:MAG: beta-ketoacyl synthase chain length factor [Chitinophagaceae bacterium]